MTVLFTNNIEYNKTARISGQRPESSDDPLNVLIVWLRNFFLTNYNFSTTITVLQNEPNIYD